MDINSGSYSSEVSDILIVDDTVNNLKLLSTMLAESGFSIRKAISGAIALLAIKTKIPDIVLLDIDMPDMDGYEVCLQIKSNSETSDIPIIFLSGFDSVEDKIKAFNLGAADYITKPFNQEEVIKRIQNQLNIRTLSKQLEHKNKALEEALQSLKSNQAKLIQQEKMAGLNQLYSGMAHEINNPLSFIMGNIECANKYVDYMQDVIHAYRKLFTATDLSSLPEGLPEDITETDFIFDDFPHLLESMASGSDRIDKIVNALQIFSAHGKKGFQRCDLHSVLDSTLVLLKSQLESNRDRPRIAVQHEYSDIPSMICDVASISQVFFHILHNAIEAINNRYTANNPNPNSTTSLAYHPQISIETSLIDQDLVLISIGDNGIGIQDAIKSRLYEPFFTTKVVSSGHGLGLFISYKIITEEHRGTISFESIPAQGTQFNIILPTMPSA